MLSFWLLDIFSRVENGVETVHLIGFDENENLIELVDDSIRPFLITEPFDDDILDGSEEYVKDIVKREGLKDKPFIEIGYKDASKDIPRIRGLFKRHEIAVYESDIYYTQVYMRRRGFSPCTWHMISNEEFVEEGLYYIGNSEVVKMPSERAPKIRPLALDIESYNPRGGEPNSVVDPILMFGLKYWDNSKEMIVKSEKNDSPIVAAAEKSILEKKPHVIATYNGNEFDWDYIGDRSEITGASFRIGLYGARPYRTEFKTISIEGRPTIDLFGIAKFVVPKGTRKSQPIVHGELQKAGLVPKETKFYEIDRNKIAELWDNPKTRQEVTKHCSSDVDLSLDIFNYAWPFAVELCRLTNLPPDEVLSVVYTILIEGFMMNVAHELNVIIPNAEYREQPKSSGAVCFLPKKGVIENVAVFDFAGMYPNILIEKNISPETFVSERAVDYDNLQNYNIITSDTGKKFYFLKKPDGFFKISMQRLMNAIEAAKKKYKGRKYTQKYAGEVQALKTIARAKYGYLKAPKSRWYLPQAQEAVASEGRNRVMKAKSKAESYNFSSVYGDSALPDSPVCIKKGKNVDIIPISEVVAGDFAWSDDGFTDVIRSVKKPLTKQVFRVLCRNGLVDVTSDHSLIKDDGRILKPANVVLGETLLFNKMPAPEAINDLPEDMAWLYGLFAAEGSTGSYRYGKTVKFQWKIDMENVDALEKAGQIMKKYFHDIFSGFKIESLEKHWKGHRLTMISGKYGSISFIAKIWRSLFYDSFSKKKVPVVVLNSSKKSMMSFLSGYNIGDGYNSSSRTRDKYKFELLKFSTNSKSLAAGLSFLLENVGLDYSLALKNGKPDVVMFSICSPNATAGNIDRRDKRNAVKKIILLENAYLSKFDCVYDLETANHHFHCGVGDMIVHNTDSIFITGIKEKDCEEFAQVLSEEVGATVGFDKFYKVIFFTEAKKIYAGIDSKGNFDYVGFVKSDWSGIANKAQTKILKIILQEKDVEKAAELVKVWSDMVEKKAFPLKDFIIWKKIRKLTFDLYKSRLPQLQVASRNPKFIEEDRTVGFIICKGHGKLWQRAKHYSEVTDMEDIDDEYYKKKQLGAVSSRILKYFVGEKRDLLHERFSF